MKFSLIDYKINKYFKINSIRIFFRTIKNGFKNIFEFLPIIWRDRDWDFDFLETLILFKLKKMEKHFRSENCQIVTSEKVANQIQEASDCLERAMEDEYLEKLGYVYKELKIENGKLIDQRTKEEREIDRKLFQTAHAMQVLDRARAYQIISENITSWWD